MYETHVRMAGKPNEGKWVLSWKSPRMKAPAFWLFDTEAEARAAERRMGTNTRPYEYRQEAV